MKTILNLLDKNNEYSVDIEFTFDGRSMVSYKTTGDEHSMVMEELFNYLMGFQDLKPPFKKGRMTLTDNFEKNEEGNPTLDLLYYDENDEQSEETPIVVVHEDFIHDIMSEIKHKIVQDRLEELCSPINEYLNSQEFKNDLIENFDEVGVKIKVNPPKQIETPRGIVVLGYDLLDEDIHQEVKDSIIFE